MDLPEPKGSQQLRDAMAAAQERFDPDTERDLMAALGAADLLVPLVEDPESGVTYAARLREPDGTQALVAFTDAEAVRAFHGEEDVRLGLLPARDLAGTAIPADTGLLLNPAGPHAGKLDRRALDIVAAAASLAFEEREEGTTRLRSTGAGFEVRPAAEVPPAVAAALRDAVAAEPVLREAWVAEVVGAGPDHLLVVVVGDGEAPPESVTDGLSEALDDGVPADVLPVTEAEWDAGEHEAVRTAAVQIAP